jgi:hypothetical protein
MEGGHYEDVKEPETEEEKEQLKFDCKAIIEIAVRDFEEASMYSNMIMGALKSGTNSYQRSDFEFMYYNKECKAKLIFKGDALFIANMMLSMSELEEDK